MNELMNIPPITCIEEKDISKMVSYAFKETNPLYPVPRIMGLKEIKSYYHKLMEELKWMKLYKDKENTFKVVLL